MILQGLRCAAFALGLLAPTLVVAQEEPRAEQPEDGVTILVAVLDRSLRTPVSSAEVVLSRVSEPDRRWSGTTGEYGTIVTPALQLGEYEVRVEMIGYAPIAHRVTLAEAGDVDLSIEMVQEAVPLEPVVVAVRRRTRLETAGFYERRESQIGYYLTRDEIEARGPFRVADLFYTIPGARVIPARAGQPAALVLLRNDCVPLIVLDGNPISNAIRLDELLHVADIEAIEVYHGSSAPMQYSQFTTCGTIMVWTRETRLLEGSPFSWRRLLAAGALVGVLFLISR
jgi:hypothetical protein